MTGPRIRKASTAAVAEAARLIRQGGLVAFPTETVYGLGGDATNGQAVAAIFAAKDRPRFNPLICHVLDAAQAEALAEIDDRARALIARFWPGPLTLVLRRRPSAAVSLLATAGLDSIAIRSPDHPVARALIEAAGVPIAAPSANRSGTLSPTTASHVAASLGNRVGMILNGGACRIGLESTIVGLIGPRPALLRPGGVPVEAIEANVGPIAAAGEGPVQAPGMLSRHYAPGRPVRLEATEKRTGEALLGFGGAITEADLDLSPTGDLAEAAANLFAMLRALDRPGVAAIAVTPVPGTGLGLAINDRLCRAAAATTEDREADWSDERGPSAPCVLPDAAEDLG
ncbi:MAG TPA: L-threonylcarbamoyladenylate synthase [Rhodospirillales bacterium]|nr:L-threonylcarbamoyladenylate synthase [Rhodospirillales bacterium]